MPTFMIGRLQVVLRHRLADHVVSLLVLVATVYLFIIIPKAFSQPGHRPDLLPSPKRAQDISFDAMREHQLAGGEDRRRGSRTSTVSCHRSVRAARRSAPTPGRIFMHLKPRSERQHVRIRSSRSCGRSSLPFPGINVYPAESADDPHRRTAHQESLSVHPAGAGSARALPWAPIIEERMRELPGFQDVTTDLAHHQSAGHGGYRSRQGAMRWASPPTRSKTRCTTPTASGRSPPSTPPINQYWVIMELLPQYQTRPDSALRCFTFVPPPASWSRLRSVAKISRNVGPLTINHLGPISRRDHFLQSRARHFAWHSGRSQSNRPPEYICPQP